ncbi:MAG: hypothetical protein Q9214_005750, partial [Letrouitia sp. 1 TL-2023]
MAGGALKYRHLNRSSAHRQALLRNLVTSLFEHESITTTWHKAKEAQRLAEKLITLGKKNTDASRRRAQAIFYVCCINPVPLPIQSNLNSISTPAKTTKEPLTHLPKLFTTLRARYLHRPGGYTRVLRVEPQNKHFDQAPSAILELVDGPRDMRFHMTAKTLVRERASGGGSESGAGGAIREITAQNVRKVTRFREGGMEQLEAQ